MGLLCTAVFVSTVESATAGDHPDIPIRLNTVGYLPMQPKVATLSRPCEVAYVVSAATGDRVAEASVGSVEGLDGGQRGLAEFTQVSEPGRYRLDVPGVGESADFVVAENVYNDAFRTAMKGMYLWRCGTAVSVEHNGDRFEQQACHLHEARLDHVGRPGETSDVTGGWHDAGDYNKYVVNGAFAAAMMLQAWERFEPALTGVRLDLPRDERANSTPDFLDEVRWELAWLLKMQAHDGRVYHKVSGERFSGYVMPSDDTKPKYLCPWSSAATADFCGVLALASRIYQPYDSGFADECLSASRRAYAFLADNPGDHQADQSAFKTGPYDAKDYDRRPWAAVELWETTGEERFLVDFESELGRRAASSPGPTRSVVDLDWDWKNVFNLAAFTYLNSEREGRNPSLVARVRDDCLSTADAVISLSKRHPYGRTLGRRYYWGAEGSVVRTSMVLHQAHLTTQAEKYRHAILDGLSHVLGRNPYGRSFVTGVGDYPPLHPHCRRSIADGVDAPWPGYLTGGANPGPFDWNDHQDDYRTNEICVNWNGALIFALASQVDSPE